MDINIKLEFANLIATIIGVIITAIGVFSALTISVITLRQTSKQIKESLKPDVQVFINYLASSTVYIFTIKNFGKTGTYIEDFSVTPDIDIINKAFKNNKSLYIAPKQSITIPVPRDELKRKTRHITINYEYTYNKNLTQWRAT